MIKYQDFAPRIAKRGPFGGPAEYESFAEVVSAVNQWIESSTIQALDVETVVLPDSLESTSDGVYPAIALSGFIPFYFDSNQESSS